MNIFDFAIEKEKLSENYYRTLAQKTGHKGLRNIMLMLADEEAKHIQVVTQLKENIEPELAQSALLVNVKAVFQKMRDAADKFDLNVSEIEMYQKAREIEQQAKSFYQEKADEVEDMAQKKIFNLLAAEEQKHYFLLDNIVEFVSRPQQWLEDAEFFHLEEY